MDLTPETIDKLLTERALLKNVAMAAMAIVDSHEEHRGECHVGWKQFYDLQDAIVALRRTQGE